MKDSATAFIGEIPKHYDKYLGPIIFEDYAADLASRILVPSSAKVLETAAGTGIASHQIRQALPKNTELVVTDLNEAMLETAKLKFASQDNTIFQQSNALDLNFPADHFDAVACQFSLMFYPDKLLSMQEIYRVLKPKGIYVFNIWDSYEHNHLIKTVNQTLLRLFPDNPLPFFDVPYGYYQIDPIKDLLAEAGFGEVEIAVLPKESVAESAKQVALGYIRGTPVCLQIAERENLTLDQVFGIVEDDLQSQYGEGSITAKMQGIVFKAHK